MKYEYLKGSEKDFEGAPEWCTHVSKSSVSGSLAWEVSGITKDGNKYQWVDSLSGDDCVYSGANDIILEIIAERRPITDEQKATLEKTRELLSDMLIPSNPSFEDAPTYRGEPITDESDLNECIGQQSQYEFIDDFVTFGKYDRQCKGVVIDVYDVLQAFEVVNPALQHLIKKALCAGLRGHKKREQDLVEILESAKRAIELEGK